MQLGKGDPANLDSMYSAIVGGPVTDLQRETATLRNAASSSNTALVIQKARNKDRNDKDRDPRRGREIDNRQEGFRAGSPRLEEDRCRYGT